MPMFSAGNNDVAFLLIVNFKHLGPYLTFNNYLVAMECCLHHYHAPVSQSVFEKYCNPIGWRFSR